MTNKFTRVGWCSLSPSGRSIHCRLLNGVEYYIPLASWNKVMAGELRVAPWDMKEEQPVTMTPNLRSALRLWDTGLSLIPLDPESKKPVIPWKKYQHRRPRRNELEEWYGRKTYDIGIVCGKISGGLIVLDFDTASNYVTYYQWFKERYGKNLEEDTMVDRSPRGFHVFFKISQAYHDEARSVKAGIAEVKAEGSQVKFYGNVLGTHEIGWRETIGEIIPKET